MKISVEKVVDEKQRKEGVVLSSPRSTVGYVIYVKLYVVRTQRKCHNRERSIWLHRLQYEIVLGQR